MQSSNRSGENATASAQIARARMAASAVVDPDRPMLTVADLGLLRDVRIVEGFMDVTIAAGYPDGAALNVMALNVELALEDEGFLMPRVRTVPSPPWTVDWMTEEGRAKLKSAGIAPPR